MPRSRDAVSVLSVWVEAPAAWINSNHRLHRMAEANLTRAWRLAAAEAIPPGIAQFDAPVRIMAHIWKPRRGRFDPNNLNPTTKACTDGFVDAGVLVDDSWDWVEGPDHRYGGKGPAGVVFTFLEP